MDRINTKLELCKLIASCEKVIFKQQELDKKQGKLTKMIYKTPLAKFIDPNSNECEIIVGKKNDVYINRLGKTYILNSVDDFISFFNILF